MTLVGLAFRRVDDQSARTCTTEVHRSAKPPRAHWRITRPKIRPPLPGPKHVYMCDDCLAEFCNRTGATVLI